MPRHCQPALPANANVATEWTDLDQAGDKRPSSIQARIQIERLLRQTQALVQQSRHAVQVSQRTIMASEAMIHRTRALCLHPPGKAPSVPPQHAAPAAPSGGSKGESAQAGQDDAAGQTR
ncbi:conserved protein of unknown function [Rhodovastum atsumiense]|uniref:Uncharacterized protein n=1 Tax=Rhodovastum atsumiense TaxID=504468 RepID=A0A5M6IV37_9PROT|nr:hypothetical protein [Rhodovastum atsumiense]KAA5611408.1 hypothetical protein F1189_14840 [Rhodovastum atsumiense]CAH2603575.1 conserved protein of unknown function [Rhodovastum atsumiense]